MLPRKILGIGAMNEFLIVLDYDGVVADSLEFCLACSREVLQRFDWRRMPEKKDWEVLEDITWEGIGRQAGLSERVLPDFKKAAHLQLEEAVGEVPVFPGMHTAVRELSSLASLAVVTANTAAVVKRVLARENIDDCIDLVRGADTPGSKSEKILRAMRKTGADKESTVMVGDTVSDIRQARAAGVGMVAVTWGWHRRVILEKELPDFFVDSPKELAAHFSYRFRPGDQ